MNFFADKVEVFRMAGAAIKSSKSRAILTTLGIIIGIVAVVTTMTAANGLANNFRESISAIGSDVYYVTRMPWVFSGNFFEMRNRPNLTLKDSDKLQRRLQSAKAVNPMTNTRRNLKYRSTVMEGVPIVGTTDKYSMITNGVPEYGRFITPFEVRNRKKICVIGSEIKEKLFNGADPINKEINIGWHKYRVVGIMEKRGSAGFFGGPNFDKQVFIPITSLLKNFGGANRNYTISVKAPNQDSMQDFKFDVIGEMRKIRKLKPTDQDNFAINAMDTLMEAYNNVMGVVLIIGLIVTGISLFVGGIGVMNIMFVSVTERTREIGVRKALGARKKSILTQFLFEACIICLMGGIIGVGISFGVAELINYFVLPASISMPIILVALSISVLTGVVSGLIPAYRASRLNPIEALRYE
jgi:putative ABC transport system permease protein